MARDLKHKLTGIIFALLLLGVGFAAGQYYLHRTYQVQVEAAYRRALSELGTHFQELQAELSRARLAVSAKQRGQSSANLRRLVYAAQGNVGELPLGEIKVEGICQLLAEIYEQTYLQEWDSEVLDELYGQVEYVNHELGQLLVSKQLEFPWVSWHEYFSAQVVVPQYLEALAAINAGLVELRPPGERPPFLRGEIAGESIDQEQAVEAARRFTGEKHLNFQVTGESKGVIPSFTVEAKGETGRIMLEVSQKGGLVLWMLDSREVKESRLSRQELVEVGRNFLEQRDFPPLHITDVQILQNRATLTFVPERNGVLRYAEPLKVQVSAEDGSILGFWATPFYAAQSRVEDVGEQMREVSWDPQTKLRAGLEILDEKFALIPGAGQGEVLTKRLGVCHEDEYYLIYLNAETGEEEQIVQVSSPEFF